jgi:hypothetical protein
VDYEVSEPTLHILSLGYSNSSILEISNLCLLLSILRAQSANLGNKPGKEKLCPTR